jgi:hypothetical protein
VNDRKKTPADDVLDLFVYAPIGLALTARELLPTLVEKGRDRVETQVNNARVMGQYAVQMGRQEAARRAEAAAKQATDVLSDVLGSGRSSQRPPTAMASTPPASPSATNGSVPTPVPDVTVASGPVPEPASLAIPDYDSLAASQVVQRLSALDAQELEAVAAYETAERGRKTILSKVAQLQAR